LCSEHCAPCCLILFRFCFLFGKDSVFFVNVL
jgi:hypothetical protein